MTRKRITREHLIAAYSANYVEYQVLEAGYLLERIEHDYGVDGLIWTFGEDGGVENGEVKVQLKATDRLKWDTERTHVLFDTTMGDIDYWRQEPMPVLLVVYDVSQQQAYWIHIQHYWSAFGTDRLLAQKSWRVKIPANQVFDHTVVERFREEKNAILSRFWTN